MGAFKKVKFLLLNNYQSVAQGRFNCYEDQAQLPCAQSDTSQLYATYFKHKWTEQAKQTKSEQFAVEYWNVLGQRALMP